MGAYVVGKPTTYSERSLKINLTVLAATPSI